MPHGHVRDAASQTLAEPGRVLRPAPHLVRQSLVTATALTAPVFAVLYWLTIPTGPWQAVLTIHLAVAVAISIVVLRGRTVTIRVSAAGLRERRVFGPVRVVDAAIIGNILLLETYRDSALDTQPQLFVCDAQGNLLLRMRGHFWSRAAMDALIDELDVPVTVLETTLTMAELRRTRPELLYWFERFPWTVFPGARA